MQGYNANNITSTKKYINRFVTHVYAEGRDVLFAERNKPQSVDHGCLLRWMQAIRLTGVKEFSLQANKSAIAGFYKWLIRIGRAERNPIEMLAAIKLPEYLPKAIPIREMERVLEGATRMDWAYPERNRAMLEVFYASGIRRTELKNLDINDLRMDCETPHIMIRQGKGKRDGIGMLTPAAIQALREYLTKRDAMCRRLERPRDFQPLFLSRTGKRIDYFSIGRIIDLIGQKILGKHIHPHQFRHSFCTDLMNRGANLMSIKELARHKNLTTTQRYLSVSFERLAEEYQKHPRNKKK